MVLRAIGLVVALCSRAAGADGVIVRHGVVVATAEHSDEPAAEATDLARALSGLAFGVASVSVGGDRCGVIAGETLAAVSAVYPFGGFTAGRFDAWYLNDHHTARVRATVVEVDALFGCRDRDGGLHLPILGHSRFACVPGERFGVGGALGDVAWDPESGRVAARYGELLAIVDLAGRSSAMTYLFGHVDLAFGVDAESVWHGRDEPRAGSDHLVRAIGRVTSLARSASARWDASLELAARPAIAGSVRALNDVGIAGEARVRYNALIEPSTAVSIGLVVHAGYWSDPSTSNALLDSVTSTTTLFAGIVLERRYESPR